MSDPATQPMRALCRLGWHRWTNWRIGGLTETVDDCGDVVKIRRRHYKTCLHCHLDRVKTRKP